MKNVTYVYNVLDYKTQAFIAAHFDQQQAVINAHRVIDSKVRESGLTPEIEIGRDSWYNITIECKVTGLKLKVERCTIEDIKISDTGESHILSYSKGNRMSGLNENRMAERKVE